MEVIQKAAVEGKTVYAPRSESDLRPAASEGPKTPSGSAERQRATFKKSHTCGSLFANCECDLRDECRNKTRKKIFQSFSHPDTAFIFTDEKTQVKDSKVAQRSRVISTRNGILALPGREKRQSTPSLGNFTVHDVVIHPEVVLKVCRQDPVTPTNSPNQAFFTDHLKSQLKQIRPTKTRNDSVQSDQSTSSDRRASLAKSDSSFDEDVEKPFDFVLGDSPEKMGSVLGGMLKRNSKVGSLVTDGLQLNMQDGKALKRVGSKETFGSAVIPNEYDYYHKVSSHSTDWHERSQHLEDEMANLRELLKNRDNEIDKLRREVHKLKSVLQQTTSHIRMGDGDLLSSLQTHHCMAAQQNRACCSGPEVKKLDRQDSNRGQRPRFESAPVTAIKKQGVSGESSDGAAQQSRDIKIPKYEKDFRSKQLIKDAIMDNDFMKNIDSLQIRELVESMYSREIPAGEYVVREGEAGSHLYVAAEGEFEVIKDGKILGTMGAGKAFGELAILYNCTRTASIRVLRDSRVWVLERRLFQQIMMRTGLQRIEENVKFLKCVPLLKNLSHDVLCKIADVLEVEFYPANSFIIRQGASGDTFYLISQGSVKVTQRLPGTTIEEEIRVLHRGDYFGEQALIKEDKRTANIVAQSPGVECLTLDRVSFNQLIGDLVELHDIDYGDENRLIAFKQSERKLLGFERLDKQELLDVKLSDLETVATLGVGGFGRVELVKHVRDGKIESYALKCLKKQHIVETHQEDHVFSERIIMLSCQSPFICRLFRTYRDSKYVYMLLEACLGGEIWTTLRDQGYFSDATTQFIIGCVLQAFEYLHARGIVYRDLKPENLMLDSSGYVKLVDFGFAKYIGYSSKTWTFCGTPEYVAPEIILNKGHDRGVDFWALGILIHELLTGAPPFTANDPMKTYNIILKGIDMVDFPRHMSRTAIGLIKKLCRDVPVERLGYQKGGFEDIKKHKWFQGFDWDGLINQTLGAPIVQPVEGPLDVSNFDKFPIDSAIPPDECSGWDADF
ncbi:cGMP-dependent protein kinase, isozyme 1 [Phlebotomus argentipes]|uniref:cGMP-dependent protein kinase, isozyme 1 n=1 Tax=Phlebotomus argentipes TaxID=94469 RepID=UPI002892C53D|nr:cGMP-dependent protein kinase, isozyme 1 [Phlebotomus argentipes]XP_059616811.1 cGMP-dependent protein kinase, isozyme 1 [Phlebotomus argentipes]